MSERNGENEGKKKVSPLYYYNHYKNEGRKK